MVNSKAEFETHIRARYPLLYVVSGEETRVIREIGEVCEAQGLKCNLWSITKGLRLAGDESPISKAEKADPTAALLGMEKMKDDGIIILLDFHPYLERDPVVVRALRDVTEAFRAGKARRHLVILSPKSVIPPEVEKSIAILDWSLPTREDLQAIAADLAKEIGDTSPLSDSVDAALGLTEVEAENAFAKSAVTAEKLDPVVIMTEKRQIIRKSGLLEYIDTDINLDQVGGLSEVKGFLNERRHAYSERARAFGLSRPKGLIVVGIAGTGKSLIAKAVGATYKMPLLKLDMGQVYQGLVGSSEENIRKVLKVAVATAPCVLWIDEIEKGFAGSSGAQDGGTSSRVLGTFLTWMQENPAPVFVVATANDVRALPPELLRKGRFDEVFFVDLPTAGERTEIFKIQIANVKRDPAKFDLALLADLTDGFTGAEIEQVVKAGMFAAFHEGAEDLQGGHLVHAAKVSVPLSKTSADKIDAIREWAKGGNARPASVQTATTTRKPRKVS